MEIVKTKSAVHKNQNTKPNWYASLQSSRQKAKHTGAKYKYSKMNCSVPILKVCFWLKLFQTGSISLVSRVSKDKVELALNIRMIMSHNDKWSPGIQTEYFSKKKREQRSKESHHMKCTSFNIYNKSSAEFCQTKYNDHKRYKKEMSSQAYHGWSHKKRLPYRQQPILSKLMSKKGTRV